MPRGRVCWLGVAIWVVACGTTSEAPITIRLIDHFETAVVEGTVPIDLPEPMVWRFDGEGTFSVAAEHAETFGWHDGTQHRSNSPFARVSWWGAPLTGEPPTLSAAVPESLGR